MFGDGYKGKDWKTAACDVACNKKRECRYYIDVKRFMAGEKVCDNTYPYDNWFKDIIRLDEATFRAAFMKWLEKEAPINGSHLNS